jgi:site-specific DNA-adenine methylase
MFGSGSVFFQLRPSSSYINDIEPLNVNLYREIRSRPNEIKRFLRQMPPEKDYFLELQQCIVDMPLGPQKAASWYYLLILCYNGVVKKKDGKPYLTWGDRFKTWEQRLPTYLEKISVASIFFQNAAITCEDYSCLPTADIAFFDPPWIGSAEDYGVEFDHARLSKYLMLYGGKWILTINDHELAYEYYRPIASWTMDLTPNYVVAPVAHGRGKRRELLMTNFLPVMYGH